MSTGGEKKKQWLIRPALRVVGLDTLQKLVLVLLADYADDDGVAYPSIPTLARDAGKSTRQVLRALQALEALELVKVTHQPGRLRSNRYHLNAETLKRHGVTETNVTPVSAITTRTDQGNVTPASPIEQPHQLGNVTPASPIEPRPTLQNVTSATGKRDISDTENVTPMSPDPFTDPLKDPKNKNSRAQRDENPGLLLKFAAERIQADPTITEADLAADVKDQAARARIGYDSEAVAKAMRQARVLAPMRRRVGGLQEAACR